MNSSSGGLLPSVALKFLRDGVKSINIVAMPSFVSTNSWNFFRDPMKTRVDPFTEEEHYYEFHTIRRRLANNTPRPYVGGVAPLAMELVNGGPASGTLATPYELHFESPIQFPDARDTNNEWHQQLSSIPSGSHVLDVYALTKPISFGGDRIKIGEIHTESELTTSVFGDERLFYQHLKVSDDSDFWENGWRALDETVPDNLRGGVSADAS